MPTPPPIKTPTVLDEAEDVPPRIMDRVGKHGGDTAPTEGTVDVDLRAPWAKLVLALAAGYALGFAIHG